ncbi:MAG: FAD-dependent oxidoreductase [Agriterribacter sp.]
MQTEYLVIGGGIAGTLISYELMKHNKSVIVIDNTTAAKASAVAGAILNPVNIKQWSIAKDYRQYIAEALDSYASLQHLLNIPVISEIPIITFDAPATREDILIQPFLHNLTGEDAVFINSAFTTPFTTQIIAPAFQIHAESLLNAWQKYLLTQNAFLNEYFEAEKLSIANGMVMYKHIRAAKIIFCEGAAAIQNPLFNNLPFTKNRGDALLVSIPGLPEKFIYHNGIRLIPTGNRLFWCGSNYTWNYTNLAPDTEWRKQTEKKLAQWLRIPFSVEDDIVAERPTTAGQQPLMLLHDSLPAALFNGLGTKGFLIAPLLAKQFVEQLIGWRL